MSLNQLHNANVDRGIPKSSVETMLADDPEGVVRRGHNNEAPRIEEARRKFNDATDSILAASDRMNCALKDTGERAKTAISKAKDQAAQLSDALNRVTKVLGPDFDKRISQLVALTDCLERLNALRGDGSMDQLIAALQKKESA